MDVQVLENRQDEKLQHQGFDILGYISVLGSSALDNPFFGYTNVKVTFNMQAQLDIARGEKLSINFQTSFKCL